jgi:hypothetical protein
MTTIISNGICTFKNGDKKNMTTPIGSVYVSGLKQHWQRHRKQTLDVSERIGIWPSISDNNTDKNCPTLSMQKLQPLYRSGTEIIFTSPDGFCSTILDQYGCKLCIIDEPKSWCGKCCIDNLKTKDAYDTVTSVRVEKRKSSIEVILGKSPPTKSWTSAVEMEESADEKIIGDLTSIDVGKLTCKCEENGEMNWIITYQDGRISTSEVAPHKENEDEDDQGPYTFTTAKQKLTSSDPRYKFCTVLEEKLVGYKQPEAVGVGQDLRIIWPGNSYMITVTEKGDVIMGDKTGKIGAGKVDSSNLFQVILANIPLVGSSLE